MCECEPICLNSLLQRLSRLSDNEDSLNREHASPYGMLPAIICNARRWMFDSDVVTAICYICYILNLPVVRKVDRRRVDNKRKSKRSLSRMAYHSNSRISEIKKFRGCLSVVFVDEIHQLICTCKQHYVVFTARSSYTSKTRGSKVCLSVCPSVRHTRALWRNERTYWQHFYATRKTNQSIFDTNRG